MCLQIIQALSDRLQDADEHVRLSAVTSICTAMAANSQVGHFSSDLDPCCCRISVHPAGDFVRTLMWAGEFYGVRAP